MQAVPAIVLYPRSQTNLKTLEEANSLEFTMTCTECGFDTHETANCPHIEQMREEEKKRGEDDAKYEEEKRDKEEADDMKGACY